MDVVMVKDFGPLLQLASTATALEEKRRMAEIRMERGGNAGREGDADEARSTEQC
jgi:hypothetical protein